MNQLQGNGYIFKANKTLHLFIVIVFQILIILLMALSFCLTISSNKNEALLSIYIFFGTSFALWIIYFLLRAFTNLYFEFDSDKLSKKRWIEELKQWEIIYEYRWVDIIEPTYHSFILLDFWALFYGTLAMSFRVHNKQDRIFIYMTIKQAKKIKELYLDNLVIE